jgi:hypothetical protein
MLLFCGFERYLITTRRYTCSFGQHFYFSFSFSISQDVAMRLNFLGLYIYHSFPFSDLVFLLLHLS